MLLADYGVLEKPAIFHNFFAENTLKSSDTMLSK